MNVQEPVPPGATGLLADATWAPLKAKFGFPSVLVLTMAKL